MKFIIPDIGGWFTPKDIEVYRALVEQIPDNGTLAELGTWKGRSLCSIADIIIKKNIKVHAIDTFEGTTNEGDAHKEAKEIDLEQELRNNLELFGITNNVTVYKMTTLEAAGQILETFDMVFIDADHSEEAVYKDIMAWKLKLNPGGRITGHDWSWESVRNAISKAKIEANGVGNVWFEGDLFPNKTFSVCFIGRNEAKFLPNALKSLEPFKAQGGEVCYLDTGSTDNTAQIARDWGCKVEEVGDKFKTIIDEEMAKQINDFFDFASARNYSAHMATNDLIMWLDCDEQITQFDIDKINQLIRRGADQFEYCFVFSHDQYGKADVEFIQSKFYNKSKLEWKGIVHECIHVIED